MRADRLAGGEHQNTVYFLCGKRKTGFYIYCAAAIFAVGPACLANNSHFQNISLGERPLFYLLTV
jgi:hypothetical protein